MSSQRDDLQTNEESAESEVELPSWFSGILSEVLRDKRPASSIERHVGTPAWPLLIDAAVVCSFLPRDLGSQKLTDVARRKAERAVLGLCETTREPAGTRWTLTQPARTEVIGRALGSRELQASLGRTRTRFTDPISKCLRACIAGEIGDADTLDVPRLEAQRVAVSLLSGVAGLELPSLDDLDRRLELERLLAQFARMTGSGAGTRQGQADRFFGRETELGQMRRFVDAIASDTAAEAFRRGLRSLDRRFRGVRPLCVSGLGGVGKTTLIAKFMLEHARADRAEFPFAYIDFDRASISARNRTGILVEMALQVGAQIPELSEAMLSLRNELREESRRTQASSGSEDGALRSYVKRFRDYIDQHLAPREGRRTRPFLLVFDTFEMAQYSNADLAGLEEFIMSFSPTGDQNIWPRLRLVLSGRRRVEQFLGDVEQIDLGVIDRKSSSAMLSMLADDFGVQLPAKSAARLIGAVIRSVGGKQDGVQPLRIRLVVDLLRRIHETQPRVDPAKIVDDLIGQLNEDNAGAVWVDGILVRRILGHVRDGRVRLLADPGLVVRYITPDVIRFVMTRGTPRPDPAIDDARQPDADVVDPWIVDDTEAQDIYQAFAREVTLVETDGNALRHRQDLRQEMLPLIQARRPNRFMALHRLAFAHFNDQASTGDPASVREAIYHGLWSGEPLGTIDRLWPASPSFDSRIDADEFPRGTPANIYLRAKGRDKLADWEIARLPDRLAREWFRGRVPFFLEEPASRVMPTLRVLGGRDFDWFATDPVSGAGAARILFRAGFWNDAFTLCSRHLFAGPSTFATADDSGLEGYWSLARTFATITGKSGARQNLISLLEAIPSAIPYPGGVFDQIILFEIFAYQVLGLGWEASESMRVAAAKWRQMTPMDQWRGELRLLRLAIIMDEEAAAELLPLYLDRSDRPPPEPAAWPILDRVLGRSDRALDLKLPLISGERWRLAGYTNDQEWRAQRRAIISRVSTDHSLVSDLRRLIVFDHRDWRFPVGSSLERAMETDEAHVLLRLTTGLGLNQNRGRRGSGDLNVTSMAIVDAALETGKMLALIDGIVAAEPEYRESNVGKDRFALAESDGRQPPQDVFGIARCLTRWHEKLLAAVSPVAM